MVHALELVHRVRRAQASTRGAKSPLWPITRQTAARQIGERMRHAAVSVGVPLPTIAAVLGHVGLSTTAIGTEHRELVARVWA